jgi:hypothetical protein
MFMLFWLLLPTAVVGTSTFEGLTKVVLTCPAINVTEGAAVPVVGGGVTVMVIGTWDWDASTVTDAEVVLVAAVVVTIRGTIWAWVVFVGWMVTATGTGVVGVATVFRSTAAVVVLCRARVVVVVFPVVTVEMTVSSRPPGP